MGGRGGSGSGLTRKLGSRALETRAQSQGGYQEGQGASKDENSSKGDKMVE